MRFWNNLHMNIIVLNGALHFHNFQQADIIFLSATSAGETADIDQRFLQFHYLNNLPVI